MAADDEDVALGWRALRADEDCQVLRATTSRYSLSMTTLSPLP
jgi:hypothetical protein